MRTQHNTATAWRRWLILAFAFAAWAALALTLALARPAPASAAAGVIEFRSEINAIAPVSNPCTGGEPFLLTGVDHLVFELTLFDDGSFHSVVRHYAQLTGTDNQGNAYIGNLTEDTVIAGQVGRELTHVVTFPVVGQGKAPNFTAHATIHFTVNADGTVTSQVANVTTTCQS